MSDIPKSEQYLKEVWAALMRGDLAERTRLCDLSEQAYDEEQRLFALHATDPLSKN